MELNPSRFINAADAVSPEFPAWQAPTEIVDFGKCQMLSRARGVWGA